MTELTSMANIGTEMARKLRAVGINTAGEMARKLASVGVDSPEKLVELGSKHAFFRIKERYPQVCLVHLYALEGAIRNVEFNSLSEAQKRELKAFSDFLRGKTPRPPETANPSENEDCP